jgi:hypothetical protein
MKLSDDTKFVLLLIAVILSMATMFFPSAHSKVFYDCRISEISPDVPAKVKEACRKMYRQRLNK